MTPPEAGASPKPYELHITVASVADPLEPDLRHEIELVKAALLYADRVTLASPKVAHMRLLSTIASVNAWRP